MEKDQVIALRKLHGEDNLLIFTDAAKIYDTKDKLCKMIWDDTNEIFYCIRPSVNYYNQDKKTLELQSSWYTAIDCITSFENMDTLIPKLQQLQSQGIITGDDINNIITQFSALSKAHLPHNVDNSKTNYNEGSNNPDNNQY